MKVLTKRLVSVTHLVEVTTDDEALTDPKFAADFSMVIEGGFEPDDHAMYIAQLEIREILDMTFTEGYGDPKKLGITAKVINCETEVVRTDG